MEDVSHDTPGEQEHEKHVQQEMQQNISQLNPEAPSTSALLEANGLDDLTIEARNFKSAASGKLRQWLCLEEEAIVNVEDDHTATTSDDDPTLLKELHPLEKVAKLQEVLSLLHKLHKLIAIYIYCYAEHLSLLL